MDGKRRVKIQQESSPVQEATEFLRNTMIRRRLAMELAEAGSWHWDFKSGELHWDDQMFRIFGRNRENWSPNYNGFHECLYPDDRAPVKEAIRRCLEEDVEYAYHFRVIDEHEKIRHIFGRGGVTKDSDGRPLVMAGVCLQMPALITTLGGSDTYLNDERNH